MRYPVVCWVCGRQGSMPKPFEHDGFGNPGHTTDAICSDKCLNEIEKTCVDFARSVWKEPTTPAEDFKLLYETAKYVRDGEDERAASLLLTWARSMCPVMWTRLKKTIPG